MAVIINNIACNFICLATISNMYEEYASGRYNKLS